ncbi:MAG TPA: hypothetical protein VK604_08860 [Bryobacteraceae bacterium]|nr:hypothetical protein [Bryobacteraceae bacterium]
MAAARELSLRHTVASLAYRAAKALRDTPVDFSDFRAGEGSRTAGEILSHLCDLLDWALSQARGKQRWRDSTQEAWNKDAERFFAALKAFDDYLASEEPLHTPAENLFQGAVADALTHVGQIALLRRLAGAAVRPENYALAKAEIGRTGSDQNAPRKEFA